MRWVGLGLFLILFGVVVAEFFNEAPGWLGKTILLLVSAYFAGGTIIGMNNMARKEGRDEGYEEGFEEGQQEGYDEGFLAGKKEAEAEE